VIGPDRNQANRSGHPWASTPASAPRVARERSEAAGAGVQQGQHQEPRSHNGEGEQGAAPSRGGQQVRWIASGHHDEKADNPDQDRVAARGHQQHVEQQVAEADRPPAVLARQSFATPTPQEADEGQAQRHAQHEDLCEQLAAGSAWARRRRPGAGTAQEKLPAADEEVPSKPQPRAEQYPPPNRQPRDVSRDSTQGRPAVPHKQPQRLPSNKSRENHDSADAAYQTRPVESDHRLYPLEVMRLPRSRGLPSCGGRHQHHRATRQRPRFGHALAQPGVNLAAAYIRILTGPLSLRDWRPWLGTREGALAPARPGPSR
jgi:hypothetical protein